MQTTSSTWQSLWQSGSARLEVRATIGGTVYDGISAPVISRATMSDGLSAGNAVSASCSFSLRAASGGIPKAAAVAVEMRLTDGTATSEWLPAGTFYISRRAHDPVTGRLSLECYDALLKANAVWTPSAGSWPRSMAAVTAELAALLGVQQDSRNVIRTGNTYQISQPGSGTTVRDVLSRIGAAHGGNWIITPANRLRLVPVVASGQQSVAVRGVLGGMDVGAVGTISGIRCTVDGQAFLTGDETGAVLSLTGAIAAYGPLLENDVIGARWQPFQLSGAVYDPAVELGDIIAAGANSEVSGPLCRETVTLGALPRGDIAAPGTEEAADEYPYIGQAAKTLTVAKAYADTVSGAAAAALDNALTQLEIFNRLTGNGAAQGLYLVNGQLYVNASYINTGELAATLIHGGTLTLGGADNVNGVLQVLDANGNTVVTLNNTGAAITNGSVVSYDANRQARAQLSAGLVTLQYYARHSGSGQMMWLDKGQMYVSPVTENGYTKYKAWISGEDALVMSSNGTVDLWSQLFRPRVGTYIAGLKLDSDDGVQLYHTLENSAEARITLSGDSITASIHKLVWVEGEGGEMIEQFAEVASIVMDENGLTVNGDLTVTGTIHN